ncbi:Tungstate-binding protein TupA {ECO:0000305} [Methanothermobacter wolfeii]|uniref:Extracellular solute-binding protein n=1 Tax=Methanothermobacter wolfeii TaxID=145261 RepID=A0A9E7RW57_METWO|nr:MULTISPECIES: substrate-binding domain-containing protein [Methanothermobacter]NLM02596.1 extracellular solute-binding protein [Methanothermobacter wolfeii]QHN06334.1 extracellular solute-binding protein [Methanothermobacter sp. THM-1]UXH32532.1 extracellular solute-binding protein [Methanothermobacter wolfeii]SCM57061.1 Tungstate-binding protein TupA {ECO:0000305} [Methanothermobacter wolfeii]
MERKYMGIIILAVILAAATYYLLGTDGKEVLRISTTTSLEDTGLLEEVEAAFEEKYPDIDVQIVSGGTGIALERGKKGDADLLIVHDKKREEEFIADGYGIKRYPFAYNYFYIIGPRDDPAGVNGSSSATEAFSKILKAAEKDPQHVKFVSRGDNSGTNTREIKIWKNITDYNSTVRGSDWYIESGSGMGDTLRLADQKGAYTISDSGTYLAYRSNITLVPYITSGSELLNVYSAIAVNPEKVRGVNRDAAEKFIEFLLSDECQKLISEYGKKQYGTPLFMTLPGGRDPAE